MAQDKDSWLSHIFHSGQPKAAPSEASSNTPAGPDTLSADNTVKEWLDHPVGGKILRDMLAKNGQSEGVLKPVHRFSLKRLIPLSRGLLTQEMVDDMIRQANNSEAVSASPASEPVSSPTQPPAKTWTEKITPERFKGKTVIVTGAGSGIGRATASRIAREGGRVIAVDISKERLEELSNSLSNIEVEVVSGDITNDTAVANIVKAAGNQIDGLANVAGIMDNMTPLHEVSDEIWDKVLAVNVTGMMKLSRAVLPVMLQQRSGAIVNVASEASLRGSAAGVAYTTSKHAVVGLTKSSAFMYATSGLRINAVAPGPVLTNIEARFDSELGSERVTSLLPTAPEAVEPDALAASICFLLSDDAVNITGVILPSDGGWSAQ